MNCVYTIYLLKCVVPPLVYKQNIIEVLFYLLLYELQCHDKITKLKINYFLLNVLLCFVHNEILHLR